MLDLGTLQLGIAVDSKEAQQDLKSFNDNVGSVKESLKPFKDAAIAVGAGIVSLGAAAIGVTESTREYRTEQAKLETAFETAGFKAKDAKSTYESLNGVLGDSGQATEAASHLAKLCDTQEELQKWTDIATGVYGTFGDSLPIESLTEAANETSKTGALTGGLADALNWAGQSEEEFQEKLDGCNSEQDRQKLIMETLDGLYKDASDNYKQNAEDVIAANEANQKMQDSLANIGAVIEPLLTSLKNFAAEGLQKLASIIQDNQPKIDSFVEKIKEFGNFLISNKDAIIAVLAGIGVGFAVFNIASVIMAVVSAVKAFQLANEGATVAQALLNIAMNANPIVLIVSLIAGLVAAIVVFIASNEEAREKLVEVWEKIKEVVSETIENIITWFKELPEKISNLKDSFKEKATEVFEKVREGFTNVWDNIKNWFSDSLDRFIQSVKDIGGKMKEAAIEILKLLWEGFQFVWQITYGWWLDILFSLVQKLLEKGAELFNAAQEIFTELWEGLKNVWDSISSWISESLSSFVQWIQDIGSNLYDAASDIFTSLWDGFKNVWNSIVNWLASALLAYIKLILGINTTIYNAGKTIITGLWNGIKNIWSSISSWLSSSLSSIVNKVTGINSRLISAGRTIINGLWNGIKGVWSSISSWLSNSVNSIVSKVTGVGSSLFNAGRSIFNSLLNGIKNIWSSISSYVSGKVSWIADKLAFWNNSKSKMSGSHRVGLREVPFDGYVAELHKGEMVLTQAEARRYQKGETLSQSSQSNVTYNVNNYSPKALDEAESARLFRQSQRQIDLGFA